MKEIWHHPNFWANSIEITTSGCVMLTTSWLHALFGIIVQLILAYSWARPAILVVGKGRGGMFLFLLFLHFHSCSSFFPVPLFHLLYSLFYLFSPFLWETTQNDPQGLTCRKTPTQSMFGIIHNAKHHKKHTKIRKLILHQVFTEWSYRDMLTIKGESWKKK